MNTNTQYPKLDPNGSLEQAMMEAAQASQLNLPGGVSDLLDRLEEEDPTRGSKRRGRRTKHVQEWIKKNGISYVGEDSSVWWIDTTLPPIVCVYRRISALKEDSDTFERQQMVIENLARAKGVDLSNAIYFEDDKSAFKPNVYRPGLQKMARFIERFEQNNQVIVLSAELARLVREEEVYSRLFGIFRRKKVVVHLSDVPAFDPNSPMADTMLALMVQLAKSYASSTKTRVEGSHVIRAARGEYRGGGVPFGMRTEKRQNDRGMKSYLAINTEPAVDFPSHITLDGQLVENPFKTEADLVRELFNRYLTGSPINVLTLWLNQNGFPNPSRKGHWSVQVVTNILRNPHYTGRVTHRQLELKEKVDKDGSKKKVKVYVPRVVKDEEGNDLRVNQALIDDETFYNTQSLLDAKITKQVRTNRYPLSGILKCATCGASLVGRPHRKTERMYSCNQHYLGNPNCNLSNLISAQGLEDFVYDFLVTLAQERPDLLDVMSRPAEVSDNAVERAALQEKLDRYNTMLAGETDDEEIAVLRFRIKSVTDKIKDLDATNRNAKLLSRVHKEGVSQFKELWDSGDKYSLHLALGSLIEAIIVEPAKLHPKMNSKVMKVLGWKTNLNRISIKAANGLVISAKDLISAGDEKAAE